MRRALEGSLQQLLSAAALLGAGRFYEPRRWERRGSFLPIASVGQMQPEQ
jgi:hypothetical protein